ncbi:hypothetical protein OJAV_G00224500 [Oryzias javanicus]|uniref:Uncharacterized protein n=1 Tax=Oryzias javanicus TaxID=123683 RepID=A0A437C1Z7_ORYJA|nr:hypothetical protein OJAV_G00224500 [Oryzias javanicus]
MSLHARSQCVAALSSPSCLAVRPTSVWSGDLLLPDAPQGALTFTQARHREEAEKRMESCGSPLWRGGVRGL